MHFLLIGASGRTGKLVLDQVLAQGHTVTALVRKASSLQANPNLTLVIGSPFNKNDVLNCFERKPDVVITTLAAPRATDSPFSKPAVPRFFMRDCVANVTAAMDQHGVSRILVLSTFGTGSSFAQLSWILKLLFRQSNMSFQYEDHDAVDLMVRKTKLAWTLVRPPMLKDVGAKGVRVFAEDTSELGAFDSCTREDVAKFLLEAASNPDWIDKAVVIAN